jgi:hypothetical protein
MKRPDLHAYLGIDDGGQFHIFVSHYELSPLGTRLEKERVFPEVIREQAGAREDPYLAVQALRAARAFLNGTQAGANPPVFGEPVTRVRGSR